MLNDLAVGTKFRFVGYSRLYVRVEHGYRMLEDIELCSRCPWVPPTIFELSMGDNCSIECVENYTDDDNYIDELLCNCTDVCNKCGLARDDEGFCKYGCDDYS